MPDPPSAAAAPAVAKKVRFSGELKDPPAVQRTGRPPRSTAAKEHPTRIMMGKANPIRDLCAFVFVMGIMIYSFAGVSKDGSPIEDVRPPAADVVGDALKVIAQVIATKRKEPCAVFMDRGTIPRTGLSLFAGDDYDTGASIAVAAVGGDSAGAATIELENGLLVSPLAFMIKHHPVLFNVEAVLYVNASSSETEQPPRFTVTASRPITAGEELFIPYDPYLHSINNYWSHIPQANDYAILYQIVQDALGVAKLSSLPKNRRRQRGASPASMYQLLRRSVSRFNVRVGNLLPASQKEAHEILDAKAEPSVAALQNATHSRLRAQGTCVNDVVVTTDSNGGGGGGLAVTKAFRKGDIVMQIPMVAIRKRSDEQEDCKEQYDGLLQCFEQSQVRLCPLVPFPPTSTAATAATVKWRWKYMTKLNEMAQTQDWLAGNPQEWMMLVVLATKDLPVGSLLTTAGDPLAALPDAVFSWLATDL